MTDMTEVPTEALEQLRDTRIRIGFLYGDNGVRLADLEQIIADVVAHLPTPPPEWSDEVVRRYAAEHGIGCSPARSNLDHLWQRGLNITLRETP